jgi:hypothetical protein
MKASAVIAVAMLCSSTAWAQSNPPMVGDKPLVQVKPKAAPKAAPKGAAQDTTTETDDAAAAPKTAAPKTAAAKSAAPKAAPGKPQSIAVRLQACLEIDDGTKGRLDCYDTVFPPKPAKKTPPPAKGVADCRVIVEQDERLTCYNGFAQSIPKLPKS